MPTTTTFVILGSIILFLVGMFGGWILTSSNKDYDRPRLQVLIGGLVTIVWVVSIAAEILIPAYTVSMLVHGIMGAVVGYLFSDDGLTINIGGEE